MKKYLFMLLAATVAFASCEKKPEPGPEPQPQPQPGSEYTSISFKQSELAMSVGETARLTLLWEPATLEKAPECTWESSNADVATVDNGVVTAIAAGEAKITAKHGDLTATCNVQVKSIYDLLEWSGMSWWAAAEKEPLTEDTFKVTISYGGGTEVSCVPCRVYFRIWGEGLYYDNGIKGEGIDAFNVGMGLLITDDLGQGPNYYILGVDNVKFVDAATFDWTNPDFLFCCPTGKINGTAEEWYAYLTGESEENPVEGSYLHIYNADEKETEDGFIGIFGEGEWEGDDDAVLFADANITWFDGPFNDVTPSYYGILLQWLEEEEAWDWSDPKVWAPTVKTHYSFDFREEEEEAPKYKLIPADREVPAAVKRHLDPKSFAKK